MGIEAAYGALAESALAPDTSSIEERERNMFVNTSVLTKESLWSSPVFARAGNT